MSDNYIEVHVEQENGDVDGWFAVKSPGSYWAEDDAFDFQFNDWRLEGTDLYVTSLESVWGLRLLLDEIEAKLIERWEK